MVQALAEVRREGKASIGGVENSHGLSISGTQTEATYGTSSLEIEKQDELIRASKSCKSLKISEMKQMLEALGVSTSGFQEKDELVRALAEVRVYGANEQFEKTLTLEGGDGGLDDESSFGSVIPPSSSNAKGRDCFAEKRAWY